MGMMMLGRSATTLLAISTRRTFFLSSSTFSSLAIVATPFSPTPTFAITPPPSRYTSQLAETQCTGMETGYLNAEDAAALDAELMSTPGFSLGKLYHIDMIEDIYSELQNIILNYLYLSSFTTSLFLF